MVVTLTDCQAESLRQAFHDLKFQIAEKPFNYKIFFTKRKILSQKQEIPKFSLNNPYIIPVLSTVLATEIFYKHNYVYISGQQPKFLIIESQLNQRIIDLFIFTAEAFIDKACQLHILFRAGNSHDFARLAPISYKIVTHISNPSLTYIQKDEREIIWIMSSPLTANSFEWIKYFLNTVGILSSETLVNKWKKKRRTKGTTI